MGKTRKSGLWISEIIKISSFFKEAEKIDPDKLSKNGHCFWDLYKKSDSHNLNNHEKITCLLLVESRLLKDSKKFVYWNHYPNMIIDIDWFELNRKKPCNIILTNEKNP